MLTAFATYVLGGTALVAAVQTIDILRNRARQADLIAELDSLTNYPIDCH